jgi:hypothetical protein
MQMNLGVEWVEINLWAPSLPIADVFASGSALPEEYRIYSSKSPCLLCLLSVMFRDFLLFPKVVREVHFQPIIRNDSNRDQSIPLIRVTWQTLILSLLPPFREPL